MADLSNLLDDLENDNDNDNGNDNDNETSSSPGRIDHDDGDGIDDTPIDRQEMEEPNIPPPSSQWQQEGEAMFRDDSVPFDSDDDEGSPENDPPPENRDDDEDGEYDQLKHMWIQELSSPELLPFDSETFLLHQELLRGQETAVEDLLERAAVNSSKSNSRRSRGAQDPDVSPMLTSFAADVYRMEAERIKFLLADLARCRLKKIEMYPFHMRGMVDRMSEEEVQYLNSYGELLDKHFRRTVLNLLPSSAWRKLDSPEMIDAPDLDDYVFCKCLETLEIDNSGGKMKDDGEEEEVSGIQEHEEGSSLIARYRTVREFVLEGKVELLL